MASYPRLDDHVKVLLIGPRWSLMQCKRLLWLRIYKKGRAQGSKTSRRTLLATGITPDGVEPPAVCLWLVHVRGRHQVPGIASMRFSKLRTTTHDLSASGILETGGSYVPGSVVISSSYPLVLAGQQEQAQDQPQPADQEQVNHRSVALSDFNKTGPLLSRALHTPFPYGRTEFILPRARRVDCPTYIKHLMKFKDGRFAGHHLFS